MKNNDQPWSAGSFEPRVAGTVTISIHKKVEISVAILGIFNFLPLHQPHLLSILGIFLLGTLKGLADLAHGRHVDPLALE